MAKGNLKDAVNKVLAKTELDEKVQAKLNKLLDKTEVDDKVIDAWTKAEESGLLDQIKCYIRCYGGYLLAVGAGCTFGVDLRWGFALLLASAIWAYKVKPEGAICRR